MKFFYFLILIFSCDVLVLAMEKNNVGTQITEKMKTTPFTIDLCMLKLIPPKEFTEQYKDFALVTQISSQKKKTPLQPLDYVQIIAHETGHLDMYLAQCLEKRKKDDCPKPVYGDFYVLNPSKDPIDISEKWRQVGFVESAPLIKEYELSECPDIRRLSLINGPLMHRYDNDLSSLLKPLQEPKMQDVYSDGQVESWSLKKLFEQYNEQIGKLPSSLESFRNKNGEDQLFSLLLPFKSNTDMTDLFQYFKSVIESNENAFTVDVLETLHNDIQRCDLLTKNLYKTNLLFNVMLIARIQAFITLSGSSKEQYVKIGQSEVNKYAQEILSHYYEKMFSLERIEYIPSICKWESIGDSCFEYRFKKMQDDSWHLIKSYFDKFKVDEPESIELDSLKVNGDLQAYMLKQAVDLAAEKKYLFVSEFVELSSIKPFFSVLKRKKFHLEYAERHIILQLIDRLTFLKALMILGLEIKDNNLPEKCNIKFFDPELYKQLEKAPSDALDGV